MIKKGLKANSWVSHVQGLMNGKGGGKDSSAQATGTNVGCLEQVVKMSKEFADEKLNLKSKATEATGSRKEKGTDGAGTGSGKEKETGGAGNHDKPDGGAETKEKPFNLDETINNHLADRSYIEGYEPSQADVSVFRALNGPPPAKYVHYLRWYKHIKSYGKEIDKFPGERRGLAKLSFLQTAASGDQKKSEETKKEETKKEVDKKDEDDFDLFGSDEEDNDEAERLKAERLKAYEEKKKGKVQIIAKSNIILDVKPWDDETDMAKVEEVVRSIEADGLLWGASKLVPLAYGIKKLQISCVVEDDKVGTDFLEEEITKFEDLVQSVDIAAFNKI